MNDNREKETFNYTYSPRTKTEIEKIREKYLPKDQVEDKWEKVRRLDASVKRTAMIWALTLGIVGTLVMGFGMCLVMTELSAYFGLNEYYALLIGIIVGLFGMALAGIAYPVYNGVLNKKKAKVAPEIIRLTDELMKK